MIQKSSMLRVLEFFFDYPSKKHSLKDISLKVNIAHTSVKKALEKLSKKGFIDIIIEKKGTRDFPLYYAKKNSKEFKKYKITNNLGNLFESGLIELLSDNLMPKSIVVFGSYMRGEDDEESDIDIFIESEEKKINTKKYEKILKRKIELHFKKKFDDYPNELKNNILNGFVIYGYLEAFV